MYHRVFLFSFNNHEEALKFVELLSEHLKGANIIVDFKGTTVKVRVYGSRNEIESTFLKIKDIVAIIKGESKGGLRKYPLRYLLTKAELKAPIPINLIKDILTLKGFDVEIKRGCVITNASLKEVQKTLEKTSEAYLKLRTIKASPKAKKVIALMMVLTGDSVEEVIKRLFNSKVINVIEKRGTYVLSSRYEEVIEFMKKLLNRAQV